MLFNDVKNITELWPQIGTRAEVVQLVKHASECKLDKLVYPLAGELKEDGNYCAMVVYDGVAYAFGRSGQRFTNVGFIESEFVGCPNGAFLCEIINDGLELEELSGTISPARVEPLSTERMAQHLANTTVRLFDFIELTAFIAGHSDRQYMYRRMHLTANNKSIYPEIPFTLLYNWADVEAHARTLIASGNEGGCYKMMSGDWRAGRRDFHSMKIVREVSYDLECTRVESGKGKRQDVVANMFFRWKGGKELKADLGKGWTDERRLEAYINPPIGRVFRVTAMGDSSKSGLLRKAKVQDERFDKKADY